MKYRKLTIDGDYSFGHSNLDFWINTPEAVGQAVKTRLELWLGEWFLNIEEGTPYIQGVIGKHSLELADTTIQDRVLSTNGVVSLENYESYFDEISRKLSVSMTINTIYGTTQIQVSNYGLY